MGFGRVPQGEKAAGCEEAGAQGAAGGSLSQDMHGGGSPSLDPPMDSWSEPPRDILECILDKLKEHRDVLLFSSVCVAWRSFISENLQRFPRHLPLARCLPQQSQLPLLMLPCKERTKACDFFCVFEQKFYGGSSLPDSNKWIWGSSEGWLVTVDIRGPEIYLFNPISRDKIHLPSKTEIPRPKCDRNQISLGNFYYLSKAALSKSPATNVEECAVMAIISTPCVLSFCRLSDRKWTNVANSPIWVDDIIYYKEQFYAVTRVGVVVACDIGPGPKATTVVGAPLIYFDSELSDKMIYKKRYLVESQGELLQVVRIVIGLNDENGAVICHKTVGFEVFKLQEKGSEDDEDEDEDEEDEEYENIDENFVPMENSSYKWVKLDDLRNQIIFLGFNQSFSLPAGALQNSSGNCIYFTDDYMDYYYGRLKGLPQVRSNDMGVFNLEDGSAHPFLPKDFALPTPPIWVSPAPWCCG